MRFIQTWSYSCANHLMVQLKENHERRRVYYYGFQVVIGAIVKGALLIALSFLLGTLIPSIIIVVAFASLRMIAGGYHMNTYGKCIFVSLAMFLIAGIVARYTYQYWRIEYILLLLFFTFVISLPILGKYAPRDTPNRPISDPSEIKKFKRLSFIHIFAFLVVCILLIYLNGSLYVLSVCLGILLELFAVSNLGHKFFDKISGKISS
ncbi:MAG: accessory gene regulator B family protein [Clostridia bacterium]|nr:accessory gene regulator B family protein [Clostridia bacterium]